MARADAVLPASLKVGIRFQADNAQGPKGWIRFIGLVHTDAPPAAAASGLSSASSSSTTAAPAPSKPKLYVGVEWDDIGRGKNDGSIGGERFFSCAAGQGSFIHPDRVRPAVTLVQAIKQKYAAAQNAKDDSERYLIAENKDTGKSFQVPVVFVGQEKMAQKLSQISRLQKVVINEFFAGYAGSDGEIAENCPNITELDLENNLFYAWEEIAKIGGALSNLIELRLSTNFLDRMLPLRLFAATTALVPSLSIRAPLSSIQRLFLNNVPNAWDHVFALAAAGGLPCLEELYLCKNRLTDFKLHNAATLALFSDLDSWQQAVAYVRITLAEHSAKTATPAAAANSLSHCCCPHCIPRIPSSVFPQLRFFNVDENHLSDWREFVRFDSLPRLERILCNGNRIASVWYPDLTPKCDAAKTSADKARAYTPFARLSWLSLGDNFISDFASVDQLNLYPNLQELSFFRNAVHNAVGNNIARCIVIAKMKQLKTINLGEVLSRERTDAEKVYLNLCFQDWNSYVWQDYNIALPTTVADATTLSKAESSSAESTNARAVVQVKFSAKAGVAPRKPFLSLFPPQAAPGNGAQASGSSAPIAATTVGSPNPYPTSPPDVLYPRFSELVAKWGEPTVAQAKGTTAAQATTLADNLLTLRFIHPSLPPVTKRVPPTIAVSGLKALVARAFKLPPAKVTICYRLNQHETVQEMDDPTKQISYYGVADGGEVHVVL